MRASGRAGGAHWNTWLLSFVWWLLAVRPALQLTLAIASSSIVVTIVSLCRVDKWKACKQSKSSNVYISDNVVGYQRYQVSVVTTLGYNEVMIVTLVNH